MKGDIDKDLAQENLKRISANFELELLRLIKTLNLISQSKELYKGQITFIQALTDKYKLRLSDFTIRLLDLERKSREPAPAADSENLFATPRESPLTPASVAGIVYEIRDYLNEISGDIEKNKNEYLQKLDSIYSVYNLQLGASQTDLDLKLRELQKEIARVAESNGSGIDEKGKTEEVTGIDYVKPSLRQPETVKPAEAETPRARNIDYIGPDEPRKETPRKAPPQAAATPKAKPEIKSTPKTASAEDDKETKIKNSYVIGAGLVILGVIVGVLFYDMLMRMWGVEEVPVSGVKTYSATEARKEPAAQAPAAVTKEEVIAPEAPGKAADAVKQNNNILPIAKPEAVIDGEKAEEAAEVKPPSLPLKTENQPETRPAEPTAGASVNYTVIGVGANVRSGPGMGNDVVTVVKEGDVFKGLGEKQGRWVKIQAPDGKEGWISAKVIRETN
ncbi:MAG: SH3 domain-containing protein [Thermodesulfobacteriota bacterium]